MGVFADKSKGASHTGVSSSGKSPRLMKGPQYIFVDIPQSPKQPSRAKTEDFSNANIDILTSKVTSYKKKKRESQGSRSHSKSRKSEGTGSLNKSRQSRGPKSTDRTVARSIDQSTVVASGSRRGSRSTDHSQRDSRSNVPRSIQTSSKSPSRNHGRSSKSPSRNRDRSSNSPSRNRGRRSSHDRSNVPSMRKSRSTTPRSPTSHRSTALKSILRASMSPTKNRDQSSDTRSSSPRSIQLTLIGSGSIREPGRSTGPSMRKSRSVDLGISSRKSQSQTIRQSKSSDISTKTKPARSRSSESLKQRFGRFTRSVSPSYSRRPSKTEESKLQTIPSPSKPSLSAPNKPSTYVEKINNSNNLIEVVPFRLGKDMTYIADGMNLDRNTRYLLAAFDARSLDDFYLMSDNDFTALVQRAKSTKNELPPLQIRKIQMLRSWIKEVVDDHLNDNDDSGRMRRRGDFNIMPNDWKEQYKNDLPHLKLQLRQQSDSIFYEIKNLFACGAGSIY